MRIVETSVYRGPNLFSGAPMIRLRIDLKALEDWPTGRLDGFTDRLLEALPGLHGHGCCYREPGGFVRRLRDSTWLGHVIEHVALELQAMAGAEVTRGKTRSVKGQPGVYDVMYRYESEAAALAAGRAAVELVQQLLPEDLRGAQDLERITPAFSDGDFELSVALAHICELARKDRLGPTTRSLVNEARRRGIPASRLNRQSLVRLGYGSRQKVIRASITGDTSHIAVENAGDKARTKALLDEIGAPTPGGAVVRTAEAAVAAAARLKRPLVVKPLNGNHGRGVSLGLSTPDEIIWGFDQAAVHDRSVIVEEQFSGRDYRILVVAGKVVAVAERKPAHVVGDGVHTVTQLIEITNRDPRRGVGHEKVMTRIAVDAHVEEMLRRAKLSLGSTPKAGQEVRLRATGNMSTGGTAIDRTDVIHPINAQIAVRAARAIGLDVAGIDFIAPDITKSVRETGGGIVEVNAAPGFRMHLEPSEGQPRDVARAVVGSLYPPGTRARIPIIAITGTNGKSTVGRMTAALFSAQGQTVGLTNTSGVYIGADKAASGDCSGPKSARRVLADPSVDVAVLECARGGILREGLAFDVCDVGVALNVAPDHMGLGGINTLEDLAAVKSVVVEAVSRRGVSVLNGDDPLTLRMARHAGGKIAYFTLNGGADLSPMLQKHLADGGVVVCREAGLQGGQLVICEGESRTPVIAARDIPATLNGAAEFNIQNALAVIAIAHAQNVPLNVTRGALSAFQSSFEENPGRLNITDRHGFRVIVDYGHNPAALSAMGAMVARMRAGHGRVLAVVSIPGDRREEDIREMGRIAAGVFDHVVFRERPDGRGRPAGSVLALMRDGALEAGLPESRMECILDEARAVDAALNRARAGDLVILFPTDVEGVWRQVQAFQPDRVSEAQPEASAHA